jgi:hypothetical protein
MGASCRPEPSPGCVGVGSLVVHPHKGVWIRRVAAGVIVLATRERVGPFQDEGLIVARVHVGEYNSKETPRRNSRGLAPLWKWIRIAKLYGDTVGSREFDDLCLDFFWRNGVPLAPHRQATRQGP